MFSLRKIEPGSFALSGDLTLAQVRSAEKALVKLKAANGSAVHINVGGLHRLDTAGALMLVEALSVPNVTISGLSKDHASLLALVQKNAPPPPRPAPQFSPTRALVERLGRGAIGATHAARAILIFFGQVLVVMFGALRHPRRFRFGTLARHIQETGIDAIPIVGLVAFLISVVLAYQGAFQLKPLGAQIFTINLVAISVLREMSVLLTSIMVAGRSGSAFTAEIGVMKVNEEVDALSMIGVEPFDMLVMPRLFALLITLPLLTFIADVVGLFGGSVTCVLTLDISPQQYWEQLRAVAKSTDFLVGMIKAPIFALIIATVGCKFGMQVSGSAESVGTYTTRSVVESIFIVLVADALFSVLFSHIGW